MRRRRILVVDDDPDIVETLQFQLRQEDYEVFTAADGFEALGAARVLQPDLVILDVMMPKENGYRVSQFIKEDVKKRVYRKNVKIVLLTARVLNEPDRREMFMRTSQADVMIYKPFDLEKLLRTVRVLLGERTEVRHG